MTLCIVSHADVRLTRSDEIAEHYDQVPGR
jgi:hypothetical protein